MTKNVLIIGYGRAGKRHGKLLDKLGIDWTPVDVNTDQVESGTAFQPSLSKALRYSLMPNFVVICTPPHLHLEQIKQCLFYQIPVLCEKPLCDLSQLKEAKKLLEHPNADRVMVAYNYRFHPDLVEYKVKCDAKKSDYRQGVKAIDWAFYSKQHRPSLPEWGLLLDHLPHTLDLLRWLTGENEIRFRQVIEIETKRSSQISAWGTVGIDSFDIFDFVDFRQRKKKALIDGWAGKLSLDNSPIKLEQMFLNMYNHFFDCLKTGTVFETSLREALKTQEWIELAGKMCVK